RSLRPSAHRYSTTTVCPMVQPGSCSRCIRASYILACAAGVPDPSTPTIGSLVCCARVANGQAAAPPTSPMTPRRFKSRLESPLLVPPRPQKYADAAHRLALLRPRHERPCRRAAEQRNKLTPPDHSMTSSARCWRNQGTSRPSALAVLRFTISSNFVGA